METGERNLTVTKIEAQQHLAELLDERAQRAAAAESAKQTKSEATARLSQLRGAMALDGTNLAKRIEKAQQDITGADLVLALWPDVSAELERRIAAAQEAVKQATMDEMRAELTELMDSERARRLAFAEALHDFAQVGADLRAMLQRKQALKMQLFENGVIIDAGSDQLDAYPHYGIGEPVAIDVARELMSKYGG